MEKLDKINAKQKYGNEYFTFNGNNLGIKLLDYWKWGSSNLLSNAIRGMFAEFIVSMAMEINFSSVRKDWKPYDIETKEGIKIEVKTSAYLQSWFQKNYSKILFSIKPARYWDTETNIFSKEKSRHSDIYIFCVLKHKDKDTVDPLNLDQWDFYVIPTKKINKIFGKQETLQLNTIEKMTECIDYSKLNKKIIMEYSEDLL